MKAPTTAALFILAASTMLASVPSQGAELLGSYDDWHAYMENTSAGKVCFVMSQPTDREPDGLKRGPAYLFITNRPKDKVDNEVSVMLGFPAQARGDAVAGVDNAKFKFFTDGENGWTEDSDGDEIVAAMRKGDEMTLRAVSTRGNATVDTYSLKGVTAALKRVDEACD
jgi:invasion protein IalB